MTHGATAIGGGPGTTTLPPLTTNDGGRVATLPRGALRIGNAILLANDLLMEVRPGAERRQVDDAMDRFRLSPTDARDVLAARAYVWSRNILPMNWTLGRSVPTSGPVNEAVARAVMRAELMNPGTAGLASRGDAAATRRLEAVIEGVIISESRARPAGVAVELQTTSATARAALALLRGDGMQAHHLIPAEVWGQFQNLAQLAQGAGWSQEGASNLMALPATATMQARLAAAGVSLPVHSGSHPDYNAAVEADVRAGIALLGADGRITSVEARAILEGVAAKFRVEIAGGAWHPRVH